MSARGVAVRAGGPEGVGLLLRQPSNDDFRRF